MNEMGAVELGRHCDGQAQLAHGFLDQGLIRHRGDEVAAHPDEYLGPTVQHGLEGLDDVVTVGAGRIEAEHSAQSIKKFRLWLLVDSDCAVSLDVRVTSHRTDAGTPATDAAAH